MKIILAPDKFKGSLSGMQFCEAVSQGLKVILPDAEIVSVPLADGGDGTIKVVQYQIKGEVINTRVSNPFFAPIEASYLFSESSRTAFIEMAEASGHKLLDRSELDCINATTLGTGELIVDALDRGAKTIILGIGGSATNDCGMGMATALGYRFLDAQENEVKPIGKNLSKVKSIDDSDLHPKLVHVAFKVACDVNNPLYGKNGAAYVYAGQKGASQEDIVLLNQGLETFSKVLDGQFNVNSQNIEGAGAAGGMGIAAVTFLGTELTPGIDLIKEMVGFDIKISDADWIITGEGMLDSQTFSGKTITGVIASAKKFKIPVAAFCGQIDLNEAEINSLGISYSSAIMEKAKNFTDAMSRTEMYLTELAKDFAKKLQ